MNEYDINFFGFCLWKKCIQKLSITIGLSALWGWLRRDIYQAKTDHRLGTRSVKPQMRLVKPHAVGTRLKVLWKIIANHCLFSRTGKINNHFFQEKNKKI